MAELLKGKPVADAIDIKTCNETSALKEKGITTERFNFSMDNLDFDLMLEKAQQHHFDVWYLCALPPSLDIFLKTLEHIQE